MEDIKASPKKPIKLVVAGSRTIQDRQFVFETLDTYKRLLDKSGLCISEVVSGDARGPDKLGALWAIEKNIEVYVMPADWEKLGKPAGVIRNAEMADYADAAIIFWDGESKGTANMIDNMKKRHKPCHIITTENS